MRKISSYFKFAFSMFTSRLIGHLILVIQLCISMILCCLMIGKMLDISMTQRCFSSLSKLNGLYFSLPANFQDRDSFVENLKKQDGVTTVCTIGEIHNQPVVCYDTATAEIYKPTMAKGIWINKSNPSKNYIPIVVTKIPIGLNIGSIIQIDHTYYKIVGELKDPAYLSFAIFGSRIDTDDIIKVDSNSFRGIALMENACYYFESADYVPMFLYSNMIAIFDDNAHLNHARQIISSYGNMSTFQEITLNGELSMRENIQILIPFVVIFLLLSVIGLIGISSLSALQNIRLFAIMNIVGAKMKDIFLIIIIYFLFSILLSDILLILFLLIYSQWFTSITIGSQTIFCLSGMAGFALLGSIVPCLILKLNPPFISYIKEA